VESKRKPDRNDIEKVLARVDFTAENVLAAAEENPALFLKVIEYRVQCLRFRSESKLNMDAKEAEIELLIRHKAQKDGEKPTEAAIKARVLLNPEVKAAKKDFVEKDSLDEYSKLLLELIRLRRDSIRSVTELTRDGMNSQRATETYTANLSEARRKISERYTE